METDYSELRVYWESRLQDLERATVYAKRQLEYVMGQLAVSEQLTLW